MEHNVIILEKSFIYLFTRKFVESIKRNTPSVLRNCKKIVLFIFKVLINIVEK